MAELAPKNTESKTQIKCPICKRPVALDLKCFPFCTERCRTIDLGKWVTESYVISRPIEEKDLDEE
jgi:endogenous inhibitor of DNA gyrase (YacG/DUF329 family)